MSNNESNSEPAGSNRAQGHGEPPEELLSLTPGTDVLSEGSMSSRLLTDAEGSSGQMNGASGGEPGDSVESDPSSDQGGHSMFPGYPTLGGAPFAAVDTPQQPMSPPVSNTDEDREDEELRPPPNMDTITGNGPVPRNRGNIGESLGTERNPPNGA